MSGMFQRIARRQADRSDEPVPSETAGATADAETRPDDASGNGHTDGAAAPAAGDAGGAARAADAAGDATDAVPEAEDAAGDTTDAVHTADDTTHATAAAGDAADATADAGATTDATPAADDTTDAPTERIEAVAPTPSVEQPTVFEPPAPDAEQRTVAQPAASAPPPAVDLTARIAAAEGAAAEPAAPEPAASAASAGDTAATVVAPGATPAATPTPTAAAAPAPIAAEPTAPVEAQPRRPGFRARGRMRRRLRYLRRLRELQVRDLGGLVFDLRRFERRRDDLLTQKLDQIRACDDELHALEQALGERRDLRDVREPGIGGTCPRCFAIHGSVDRFCANCGAALGGAVQGPAIVPAAPSQPPPEASGAGPQR